MKKVLASLLALSMLFSMLPSALAAEAQPDGVPIPTEEVEGLSRLDGKNNQSDKETPIVQPLYDDDDMIVAIVELDSPSLLDYYNASSSISTIAKDDMTPGEAVSQYLISASKAGKDDELRSEQNTVLRQIQSIRSPSAAYNTVGTFSAAGAGSVTAAGTSSGLQPFMRWVSLVNGFAIRVPYGMLDSIKALDGVKAAYVSETYTLPDDTVNGDLSDQLGTPGYAYDMVSLSQAWDAGYTGKGILVAVLDTGLDAQIASYWEPSINDNVYGHLRHVHEAFTDNSFRSDDPDSFVRYPTKEGLLEKVGELNEQHILHTRPISDGGLSYGNIDGILWKTKKVPFAYDYSGLLDPYTGEVVSGDGNVWPGYTGEPHGTHVSGTAVGYAESEDGAISFSGVAPDAQLIMMKVFDDSGTSASDFSIIAAMEDAMALGVDVINMSLGSNNGFANNDSLALAAHDKLQKAGIVMMVSAGNSYYSAMSNLYGNQNLAGDPDISMVANPSTYSSNLSVAAINSDKEASSYLHWYSALTGDHRIEYADPASLAMKNMFTVEMIETWKNLLGGEGVEFIDAGLGTPEDYEKAGFSKDYEGRGDPGKTGIALVRRGGTDDSGEPLTFTQKIQNAMRYAWVGDVEVNGQIVRRSGGVLAVIVYDSNSNGEDLIYMSVDGAGMVSSFISGKDGAAIINAIRSGDRAYLTEVEQLDTVIDSETAREMSTFSSWGSAPGLELKPEITAPGGNIWSAMFDVNYPYSTKVGTYTDYVGSYGMMSGTSMAAPHMAGLAAIVCQYVKQHHSDYVERDQDDELINALLVSTAVPQMQKEQDAYYSPRQQGAGLANVGAAVSTPAYISVDGKLVGKLELGDDWKWTGKFPAEKSTFTVHNLTNENLTYSAKLVLQRPATGTTSDGRTTVLASDFLMRQVDLAPITVPASGTKDVTVDISLTEREISDLKALFPNGTFIEGFIILTANNGKDPQIGLPFLGFLGDWTAPPIFDHALWLDHTVGEDGTDSVWNQDYAWMISTIAYYDGYGFTNLAENPFDPTSADTQEIFYKENIALSNAGGYMSAINDVELYQLRDAKALLHEVIDADTGEIYHRQVGARITRTIYDSGLGAPIPISLYVAFDWQGMNDWMDGQEGVNPEPLENNTHCIYRVTAYGDGDYPATTISEDGREITDLGAIFSQDPDTEPTFNGHPMDKTGDVIEFPVLIDNEAPTLVDGTLTYFEDQGHTYLTGTFTDNGSIASIEVCPEVVRINRATGERDAAQRDWSTSFFTQYFYEPQLQRYTFVADITSYQHQDSYEGESDTYDFQWTGNVYTFGGDYAGNDRGYYSHVGTSAGLSVLPANGILDVGNVFNFQVVDNVTMGKELTYVSDNPEVVSVTPEGRVTANAVGQAVITVSNGREKVDVVLAVREPVTEVEDFKLSIDHFSKISPDGSVVIKVTDLKPANVQLSKIWWETFEDEDWAADWGEGLVTVTQYSSDGLTGEVFLTMNGMEEEKIPEGSGKLRVTLNDTSREMTFDWADLYTSTLDDGLIGTSGIDGEQVVYATFGQPAFVGARYRQESHNTIPVVLYTDNDAVNNSTENPVRASVGLRLDGPDWAANDGEWRGFLVNEANYKLPDDISIYNRHGDGREIELGTSSYGTPYTYNPETGEIVVSYAPAGADSTMVIRADGVQSPGTPAGIYTGDWPSKPAGIYGPFEWKVVSGVNGTITESGNGITFLAEEPGVSFLRATDGTYSLDFAVVTEPVRASYVDVNSTTAGGKTLNGHNLEMNINDQDTLSLIFEPTPTTAPKMIWKSYNEDVVSVDENGKITAHKAGYAYIDIMAESRNSTNGLDSSWLETYCIIHVVDPANPEPQLPPPSAYKVSFRDGFDYTLLENRDIPNGEAIGTFPTAPVHQGYNFTGWTDSKGNAVTVTTLVTDDMTIFARYQSRTGGGGPGGPGGGGGGVVGGGDGGATIVDPSNPDNPTPPDDETGTFTDVSSKDWFYDAVNYVTEKGLMNGTGGGVFSPNGTTTRAQIVTILHRLENEPEAEGANFTDVPDGAYFDKAVDWASANGIVNGMGGNKFAPDENITREQFAAILYRYAKYKGYDMIDGADLTGFADFGECNAWGIESMSWANAAGLITGVNATILSPQGNAIRAQAATILMRFIENIAK